MSENVLHQRVTVPDTVLYQTLPDGETVFLDLGSEQYFGLDATATRMWMALVESGTASEAHARLLTEFEAEPEKLRDDLLRLTQRLVDRGLLAFGDS